MSSEARKGKGGERGEGYAKGADQTEMLYQGDISRDNDRSGRPRAGKSEESREGKPGKGVIDVSGRSIHGREMAESLGK